MTLNTPLIAFDRTWSVFFTTASNIFNEDKPQRMYNPN